MSRFYTNVVKYGNNLLLRYVNNGQAFKSKVPFGPTLFVPKKDGDSDWHTLEGAAVSPVKFESIKEASEYVERYKDVEGFTFYGQTQFQYQYITETYNKTINWDKDKIKLFSIDIETATENGFPDIKEANEEILLITIKDNNHKQIVTFGSKPFMTDRPDVKYIQCTDESNLLRMFVTFWSNNYPDVVTGWNIKNFDIPYLTNRIRFVLGDEYVNRLSPWGQVYQTKGTSTPKLVSGSGSGVKVAEVNYNIVGISVLDYLDLYKKFTYSAQESYKLDHIASVELGMKKLDYSEYNSLHLLYKNNFEKFIEMVRQVDALYNIIANLLKENINKRFRFLDYTSNI